MKQFIIKDYSDTFDAFRDEEVTMKVDASCNLDDVLNSFERFLRAVGYYFDGHLDIVEDVKQEVDESEDGEKENEF
jgi:hypothetical protein